MKDPDAETVLAMYEAKGFQAVGFILAKVTGEECDSYVIWDKDSLPQELRERILRQYLDGNYKVEELPLIS